MSRKDKREEETKGKKVLFIIKNIVIVLIMLLICLFVLNNAKYYIRNDIDNKINLVINNNNVTAKLKENIIIEDDVIYLSVKDIKNFFDYYIYEDKQTNQIITTSDKKVAAIGYDNQNITVNGANYKIRATAIKENESEYLPMSELKDVYDVDINYLEDTNIITIDSLSREQIKATISKNTSVKLYPKTLSRTVDKIKKGDIVIIVNQEDSGWTKIRTISGKLGYVKTKQLTNYITVREKMDEQSQVDSKVNMFWDYYSEFISVPDRTGEVIEGVNVVSPSFFYINKNGQFTDKIKTAEKEYIEWAHNNGYKVWAMLSNTEAGIKVTSTILNSYENRQKLIESVVESCVEYKIDGINIDFENMYEEDKDMFSRFIIELVPRMKEVGLVTSVDVTAPDGAPNWSLCYDRYVLGNIADYIVFMGYDQYGTSSKTPGTTAGYNWVETSLKKFIDTYEVNSEKIILGIPFYTRIWTETQDGKVSSRTVDIKDIDSVIPEDVEKVWNDTLKQYYVEYNSGSTTKKMWIEDENSIREKVSLVKKYNLGGVSAWEKDRETDLIWQVINEELENSTE